jgi:hypothetical protein
LETLEADGRHLRIAFSSFLSHNTDSISSSLSDCRDLVVAELDDLLGNFLVVGSQDLRSKELNHVDQDVNTELELLLEFTGQGSWEDSGE